MLFTLFLSLVLPSAGHLPPGIIMGIDREGRSISARLGVRYAEKPERFQMAEMAKNWRDSSMETRPNECLQAKLRPDFNTSEDCLFMNVFGPTRPHLMPEQLPVLVYIHGGAYKLGSGNEFDPENMAHLAKQGFVVISLQYRLSVLGFFHLNGATTRFPPNLGLHDTHLALKFIKKHIHEFGGNSDEITLIGQSAGACSAHALSISPVVEPNLFKRIVLMSAVTDVCFNGSYGTSSPSVIAANSICQTNVSAGFDEDVIYDCLSGAEVSKLEAIDFLHEKNWVLYQDDYFFPQHPKDLDRSSRGHDILMGVTTGEWAFFENLFAFVLQRVDYNYQRFEETLKKYAGIEEKLIETTFTDKYLFDKALKAHGIEYWYEKVVESMTDVVFHLPLVNEVQRMISAENPPSLYLYMFNVTNSVASFDQRHYASHSDDLQYLFGNATFIDAYPHFRNVILGFAKNGAYPTPALINHQRSARVSHNKRHHRQGSLVFNSELPYTSYTQKFCPRTQGLRRLLQKQRLARHLL